MLFCIETFDTRRLAGAAVPLFLVLSVSALAADQGKVVPLSAEYQKALALSAGATGKTEKVLVTHLAAGN